MTASGSAAWRRWRWLGAVYVVVCVALAAVVFFAPYINPLPYWGMVLLTAPLSGIAFFVNYVGFILIFGPEDWWLPRTAGFLMWVGVAVAQVGIARLLLRALAPPDATGTAVGDRTG